MLIKKQLRRLVPYFLVGIVLFVSFWVTRLINFTLIPIFTDEAIYLRWAQIGLGDPRWRFISLTDGKQPLLIWLFFPAMKIIKDPLVAGRVVAMALGCVGMFGLCIFGWLKTRTWKGAFIGGLLYILIPFFLVYDRFALYESLLTAISIWTLLITYIFAQRQRLDIALVLGTAIGAGLLTKSSANFFWILLPATLLLIPLNKKNFKNKLLVWMGLIAVVILQSQIYNNILRLSEFRHAVRQKELEFVYSLSDFIQNPTQQVFGNLAGLTSWLISYLTWPVALLVFVAMIWYIKQNRREGIFFLIYFIVPFVLLAFFGKIIYPRFLIFMMAPLLIPTIIFLHNLTQRLDKKILIAGGLMILIPAFYFNIKLLTDPIHAPFPLGDRQQFLDDWPAGYGVKEVISYIESEAQTKQVIIGTEGTFGLFPMALELYLGTNKNVTIKPFWPVSEVPQVLIEDAKTYTVYLVFKERQNIPSQWPLVPIAQYQRGAGSTYLKFYRVIVKT